MVEWLHASPFQKKETIVQLFNITIDFHVYILYKKPREAGECVIPFFVTGVWA
jgi:hypothetical protein